MKMLLCGIAGVRIVNVQKLCQNSLSRSLSSRLSLSDIKAKVAQTSAAKEESAKLAAAAAATAAVKPKLTLGQQLNSGSVSQFAKKAGDNKQGEKGLNLDWAQTAVQKKKDTGKFSVDASMPSQFVSKGSSSSIRDAIRKAEEAKAAVKKSAAVAGALPGTLQGSLFGARPAQAVDDIASLQATTFAERKAAFDRRWQEMAPNTPLYAPAQTAIEPPSRSERFEERRQDRIDYGQQRKRQEFDERMGLDKNWRTPVVAPGEKGWHRDADQLAKQGGSVEISVSQLKQELLQKKQAKTEDKDGKSTKKAVVIKEISIPEAGLTVRELASRMSMKTTELTKRLVEMGVLEPVRRIKDADVADASAALNEVKPDDRLVDADSAELLVLELGFNAKRVEDRAAVRAALLTDKPSSHAKNDAAVLVPRAPVVCVMGHVDHGKTTLLDTLRKFNHSGGTAAGAATAPSSSSSSSKKKGKLPDGPAEVAGTEAGGITQKLSAFGVEVSNGRRVMFLDTPGHAAFSAMRSHGAIATDLVILVVAIDDGVRPQTIEALRMAKEAECSIIVVLNKIDRIPAGERPAARQRVLSQLLKHELIAEEFGGEVQVAEVAGRTGEGIPALMDMLLLQAEVLELQAAVSGQAEAVVLDASMEKGKGVVAEVLVRWGALNVGDSIVVGGSYGKVKSMINDRGEAVRTALPSDAVRLQGLRVLPVSGQEMLSVENEDIAKEIADRRVAEIEAKRAREQDLMARRAEMKARLEAAALAEAAGEVGAKAKAAALAAAAHKAVKIDVVIKADGVGTLHALKQIVQGIASRALKDVQVDVVHSAVGDVNQSDVELASAGEDSLILAFNVGIVDGETRTKAKMLDVNVCRSDIIYRLEDELVRVMLDHLPKERSLIREGTAKVQKVFTFSGAKAQVVAGLKVESGTLRTKVTGGGSGSKPGETISGFVFTIKRNGKVLVQESKAACELKRSKDVVHEVEAGLECGLTLSGFTEFQEGDEIECHKVVWSAPTTAISAGDSGVVQSSAEGQSYEGDQSGGSR